jgi:hypothetical protein
MEGRGFEERGRQTGCLSNQRTEGLRTDRTGPTYAIQRDGVMPTAILNRVLP